MSDQAKVDDLFDQMSAEVKAEAEAPKDAAATPSETPAPAEAAAPTASADTATPTELSTPVPSAPSKKGVFGSEAEPKFANVIDALKDRVFQTEKRMRINEDLMMTYLFREEIHEAYYKLWREDSNKFFRLACNSKRRREKYKKAG